MSIKKIILKSLESKHTEQVIKLQMIELAQDNLYNKGIADALAKAFPLQDDLAVKQHLLDLLLAIDTSRLLKPKRFYKSLINVLATEKEQEIRTDILNKLASSINHSKHIMPFFAKLFTDKTLKDREFEIVLYAMSQATIVKPKTVIAVLQKAVKSTLDIQEMALDIAEKCPNWNNDIKQALKLYLTATSDKHIKSQIINRLQEAKLLDESFIPLLINIAATDQQEYVRSEALEILSKFTPLRHDIVMQLAKSSMHDASESIRQEALRLQKNILQLNTNAILKLLTHLNTETKSSVRIQVLGLLESYLKKSEVRDALLKTYTTTFETMESEELYTYLELLEPYMTRNKNITTAFLKNLSDLPKVNSRQAILQSLLEHGRITDILDKILTVFTLETNDTLRKEIFLKFKQLSLAKYPRLVTLFCQELQEPSSSFRIECATALEPNILQFKEITTAFEDVLLYDQDQELVRICLNGYFKPGVKKKFEPLLRVIENEFFDLSSRQKAVATLELIELSEQEKETLSDVLKNIKAIPKSRYRKYDASTSP